MYRDMGMQYPYRQDIENLIPNQMRGFMWQRGIEHSLAQSLASLIEIASMRLINAGKLFPQLKNQFED